MEIEIKKFQLNSLNERTQFRLWLQRQFTERCKKNSNYSLRSFAKKLNLDPSSLSQMLSGKRTPSPKNVKLICEQLGATPRELQAFGVFPKSSSNEVDYLQIAADNFTVIADWYHIAILELTFVPKFNSEAKWIAQRLSITVDEAKAAIERLIRLGLLLRENGMLIKSSKHLTNHSAVNTSAAHRQLQKQVIEKALEAIENCSPEEKDITSMTMAIDVSKLDQARDLTKKYRRDMCELLEEGDQTRVYNLGIQLYPISKKQENI